MSSNFIIHQKAKKYQWSGDCFLSLKSFYGGNAIYQVKQREYWVDQSNFLILNDCTKYRLTIDTTQETESFCIFFSSGFVAKVVSEHHSSDEQLLEFNPTPHNGMKLLERNYYHKGWVSQLVQNGRAKSKRGMLDLEKEEFYHTLLNAILQENSKSLRNTERLDFKKKSTREEIYKRLLYAKDFLDCNYAKDVRLRDIASVGLMSENHFIRNFHQMYGLTPFQYISQKRIKEAKRQILETNRPIKDIAIDMGYSSLGNFSTYFKQMVGQSPSAFRKR